MYFRTTIEIDWRLLNYAVAEKNFAQAVNLY